MSFELLYTSTPSGLKPGTRGFATVLCTAGIPPNVAQRLETLSGYRHVFSTQDPRASENPVCYSHLRVPIAGRPTSVLSRIAAYGVDYSGRTNKIAHHVVLDAGEQIEAGPAWLLRSPHLLRHEWDRSNQVIPNGPAIPIGNSPLRICETWRELTGDAGWGGVVADAIANANSKTLWIVFRTEQSTHLLPMIEEALAILPASERWQATFSTYYTNLPPEVDCRLRCVVAGSEEAKLAPARGQVIDISSMLPLAPPSLRVDAARTGVIHSVVAVPSAGPLSVQASPSSSSPIPAENQIESLWPDELQIGPPAVRQLPESPPSVKTSGSPLPPNIPSAKHKSNSKNRFVAMLIANGMATASVFLILVSAAILIPVTYHYSKTLQQLASAKTTNAGVANATPPKLAGVSDQNDKAKHFNLATDATSGGDSAVTEPEPNEVGTKEVESKEVESKEVESKEVESKEVESKEVGPKEVGPKEVGPKVVESKEVESKEVGPKEVGPKEVGPKEVGPKEVGPKEVGPKEVGPKEVAPMMAAKEAGAEVKQVASVSIDTLDLLASFKFANESLKPISFNLIRESSNTPASYSWSPATKGNREGEIVLAGEEDSKNQEIKNGVIVVHPQHASIALKFTPNSKDCSVRLVIQDPAFFGVGYRDMFNPIGNTIQEIVSELSSRPACWIDLDASVKKQIRKLNRLLPRSALNFQLLERKGASQNLDEKQRLELKAAAEAITKKVIELPARLEGLVKQFEIRAGRLKLTHESDGPLSTQAGETEDFLIDFSIAIENNLIKP